MKRCVSAETTAAPARNAAATTAATVEPDRVFSIARQLAAWYRLRRTTKNTKKRSSRRKHSMVCPVLSPCASFLRAFRGYEYPSQPDGTADYDPLPGPFRLPCVGGGGSVVSRLTGFALSSRI